MASAGSVPARCVVTGGSGFVGQRLVEMLIERGATSVVSFDLAGRPPYASSDPRIRYVQGNIENLSALEAAFKGADCIFHIAALVGPFYKKEMYWRVNLNGTKNVIAACKSQNVRKVVCAGTPSTRMDGRDIDGKTEDELPMPKRFTAHYAETKALAELALREAAEEGHLLTVTVCPHQVYGPRDALFFPNILKVAKAKRLRVFGAGKNRISMCHVDNYCHGLILGAQGLYPGSVVLNNFYIVTDGPPVMFWQMIDEAVKAMGFNSIQERAHLPYWLLISVAYLINGMAKALATIRVAEEHVILRNLKLNVFTVTMLTIHRYFDISKARKELGYTPLKTFEQGMAETLEWFKREWLTDYRSTEEIRDKGWNAGAGRLQN